jgi:hypothetical protein
LSWRGNKKGIQDMTLEEKILKKGSHTFKVNSEKHHITATDKGYHYRGTTFRLRSGKWYVRRKGKGGFDKSSGTADLATAVKFADSILIQFGKDRGEAKIKAIKALESASRNVRTVREIFNLYWFLTDRKTKKQVFKDFLAASYIGQNKEAWPISPGDPGAQKSRKVLDIDESSKKKIVITSGHKFVEAILNQPIEDAWNDDVTARFKQFTRSQAQCEGEKGSQEYELVIYNENARLGRAKALFTKELISGENKAETYQLSDRERFAVKSANDIPQMECNYSVHYVPPADGTHGQKTWELTKREFQHFANSHLPDERNIFRSILLGLNGAFRNSEITKLKWSDIHGQLISLKKGQRKNKKGNTIQLSKWSLEQLLKLKDKKHIDNGVRIEDVANASGFCRSTTQAVLHAHHRYELGLDKYLGQGVAAWKTGWSKKAYKEIVAVADSINYQYCPRNGQAPKLDGSEAEDFVLEGTAYQRGEGNWNRVNAFLLGIGWKDPNGGQKLFYRLRKHLGSIVYQKLGVEAAAKLLGNSIAVVERHYATYFDVIENDWLDDLGDLSKEDNVIDIIDKIVAA